MNPCCMETKALSLKHHFYSLLLLQQLFINRHRTTAYLTNSKKTLILYAIISNATKEEKYFQLYFYMPLKYVDVKHVKDRKNGHQVNETLSHLQ